MTKKLRQTTVTLLPSLNIYLSQRIPNGPLCLLLVDHLDDILSGSDEEVYVTLIDILSLLSFHKVDKGTEENR